jgi:fluoride exporter
MSWLLVLVGGAVGAPVRYLVDRAVSLRSTSVFPLGTLTVNLVGCFILGCLAGAASENVRILLGTGFCGALTTFSTFGYETSRLASEGSSRTAVANVVLSVGLGLAVAALGVSLTT